MIAHMKALATSPPSGPCTHPNDPASAGPMSCGLTERTDQPRRAATQLRWLDRGRRNHLLLNQEAVGAVLTVPRVRGPRSPRLGRHDPDVPGERSDAGREHGPHVAEHAVSGGRLEP